MASECLTHWTTWAGNYTVDVTYTLLLISGDAVMTDCGCCGDTVSACIMAVLREEATLTVADCAPAVLHSSSVNYGKHTDHHHLPAMILHKNKKAVLQPFYSSTFVNQHSQLRTGEFR